jgi:disulfide oxidoreductase YuzD
MDEQFAKKSIETFNLKNIQNRWFIEADGKLHHLDILNDVESVHMEENVIFADESMYKVIVKDNGELKIDKINDLCKSIGQEKVQPDKKQLSENDEEDDSDCNSEGVAQDSKGTLNMLPFVLILNRNVWGKT